MLDYTKNFDPEIIGVVNHAKRNPDRPALIMNDITITYQELDRQTNALANALLELGIESGDRLSVLMHNCPELLMAWSASGKIGVTPIAINYRFKKDELSYIINDSGSKLLIYGSEFEELVKAAEPDLKDLSLVYICAGNTSYSGVHNLEELIKNSPDTPPQVGKELVGVSSSLIYTSGTTGRPKGVFKSSKSRLNTLLGYAVNFEFGYDDMSLVAGPLYHSAPYAWASVSLILGNTVVIMPRFDAENFLKMIQDHKITITFVVPTMLNRILKLPEDVRNRYDISSLRRMTVAAESFPFPLKKHAVEFFGEGKIFEFYGATESGIVTYIKPKDQLRKPGSCGVPLMGNEIKLLDEDFNEVGVGEVGILYSKSDFIMDEYYKNPGATQACYHDGYFTVGDMARVDEEGYYYIVDRAVDMIISGGVNIYPAEIEEVLYHHPQVYDVSVIGAKDPDWGEKIVAYVVLKQGRSLNEEDIINYVGEKLASYKKPKEVIFVDEIPYSPSGKQLKRVLRDEYEKTRKHPEDGQ